MCVQVTAAAAAASLPTPPPPPRNTVPSMHVLCFSLKIEIYNALAGVQLLNLDKSAIVHQLFAGIHTS
jgi:hypothetical protein